MKHAKLTIKTLPLDSLKPHPRNPRKHPTPGSEEWTTLKRSLADSYFDPLVFNTRNGFLVSGHLRAKVLAEMGVAKADCVVVDFDEDKHVQIMLRANTNSADWDDAALANILKDMTADQALMAGFSAADIAGLETDAGAVMKKSEPADNENEQHLQELVAKWKTAPDQLWQIGPHRLRIGSATDPIDWTELMQGQRANLVFTDPPYGVSYHSSKSGEIQNDDLRRNALTQMLKPAFDQMVQHAEDNAAFYIWHATSTRRDFEWALDQSALEEAQYLTWVKDSFVMGRADYHWATEPAFYCQKAGHHCAFYGDRKQSTVWRLTHTQQDGGALNLANGIHISDGQEANLYLKARVPKAGAKMRHIRLQPGESIHIAASATTDAWEIKRDDGKQMMHPNQKPPELAMRAINNSTASRGAIVADCFAGSGSTLIACHRTGRAARLIELDPKFAALIIERAHKETAEQPALLEF